MTRSLFCTLLLAASLVPLTAQEKKAPLSPPMTASGKIGSAQITIKYSAPSLRGRTFGSPDFEPYGNVWRTGANEATALQTTGPLMIGDAKVPAGSYTLYSLRTADAWTLIVNKQTGQWGTEYSQGQDLARVKMQVAKGQAMKEQFAIMVEPGSGNKGTLKMAWGDVVATAPVTAQ